MSAPQKAKPSAVMPSVGKKLSMTGIKSITRRLDGIPTTELAARWLDEDPTQYGFKPAMGREDEEYGACDDWATTLLALVQSAWFWEVCEVFPKNRIWWGGKTTDLDKRREGKPNLFPDYMLFLVSCLAGTRDCTTYRAMVAKFRLPKHWHDFCNAIEDHMPAHLDWTRPSDLRARDNARARRAGEPERLYPNVMKPNVLDYWLMKVRGFTRYKGDIEPLPDGDPYVGVMAAAQEAFRRTGVNQAQAMGLIHPRTRLLFFKPNRNLFIGGDAVVFSVNRRHRRDHSTTAHYVTGEGKRVYGSKFMIMSTRVDGLRHSRVILDLRHVHSTLTGSTATETQAAVASAIHLRDLSQGGVRGLLYDSALRGEAITELQRHDIIATNYCHAESNPDGGPGKRLGPGRREKSRYRTTREHRLPDGSRCQHHFFFAGGELVELTTDSTGNDVITHPTITDYESRPSSSGDSMWRQSLNITFHCPWSMSDHEARIPLFHTGPLSPDPDINWGEVVRVFAPGSWQFRYLYGARNDTESRHRDLKARVKYLPGDRTGQTIRLLGAALSNNALSWQYWLEAQGQTSVFTHT